MIKSWFHLSILLGTFCFIQIANAFPNRSKSAYSPPNEGKEPQKIRIQGTRRGECISKNNIPEFSVNSLSDTNVSISFPKINQTPLLFVVFNSSGTIIFSKRKNEPQKDYKLRIPINEKDLTNDRYELRTIVVCRPELALNPYLEIILSNNVVN